MKVSKLIATILLFVVLYALFALVIMLAWNLTFQNLMSAEPMHYPVALAIAGFFWAKKIFLV